MSVQISSVRNSGRRLGQDEAATVGGLKPLHRFLKGQPQITGIVVLILGASLFCVTLALLATFDIDERWTKVLPGLMLAAMFVACGILYIVTEKNPTKRTVTISLALSIISVLCTIWVVAHSVQFFKFSSYSVLEHYDNGTVTEIMWPSNYEKVARTVEAVFKFNGAVGGIICLVMSVLAGAALRSTASQAIVLMTATATETPTA
ncbi:uncharacterized protein LOC115392367 [Salarias fasciatus]|uniref:uncharacterized protein LOC115392367 n=1 Tax=Salarias fasciatus TaxID=181472 RepID=UPI001176FCF7|nr:uncharacterized protein LOC115392367 [Salarias fasciatus]